MCRRTGGLDSVRLRPAVRLQTIPNPRPFRSLTIRSLFSGRPGCWRSVAGLPPCR